MPFSREEREMPVHCAATVAFKFTRFKSGGLQHVEYTAREVVQNTHHWSRRSLEHHIRTEWAKLDHAVIAAAVRQCGVVVFQLVSERAMVISSTAFNSVCFCDNCGLWSLHWLVESNSCKLIFWSDFLPVVSHDVVYFNKWRSFNSQGKVVTLIRCGGLCCVNLVSHYLNDIPCKNYSCVFVFVKVIPKILLVPFFPDTV